SSLRAALKRLSIHDAQSRGELLAPGFFGASACSACLRPQAMWRDRNSPEHAWSPAPDLFSPCPLALSPLRGGRFFLRAPTAASVTNCGNSIARATQRF